ncbi:hypothetical protein NC99_44120 [Sunxiuqinia dokdonensis]|uniref:Uncharacterized protein n=1 Tax=Sunxiuqinia dokdonensis TaxID=1409788 RepID=A0A0L8V2Y9_9BACT|nr:hypothetical protein NC99_44120 [Sunxiuqinia dokdonensis]
MVLGFISPAYENLSFLWPMKSNDKTAGHADSMFEKPAGNRTFAESY